MFYYEKTPAAGAFLDNRTLYLIVDNARCICETLREALFGWNTRFFDALAIVC